MKKLFVLFLLTLTTLSFSQEIKFGKVSKEELTEKFYPQDSSANAAYLFKKRRSYYNYSQNDGFQLITDVHERIKIYNKDGFNKANKLISYYKPKSGGVEKVSSIKGYTFNLEDNKVVKEKLSSSGIFDEKTSKYRSVKKLILPNIKEGSVIDLKYKITSPYETSIDDLEFQFDIPVKQLECKIEIPEFYIFNKKSKGYYSITPKKSTRYNKFNYKYSERGALNRETKYSSEIKYKINTETYEASNIPALKDNEPYVGSIQNYRGGLKYELTQTNYISIGGGMKYYSTDWSDVSKRIYASSNFGGQLDKISYFKDDLSNIIAKATNDFEKTFAIFQFVKSKVKWNEYYGKLADLGVKKAYKEGIGNSADINLMLTAMLRESGLNANPVLVSTRKNGVPLFPTIDGFNYVISMVEFPDNSYVLLDATEPYSLPNILPVRALNWNGRKITKDGNSSWVKLTSNKPALEENMINIKIVDGTVSGLLRTKYDNLNALNFRNVFNHLKDDELITKLEEKYSIEVENYRLSNKKDVSKPINQMAKFSSEDLIEEINDKLYINPLLFLTQETNPFKSEERKFPVDFSSPWKDVNNISIQIPEGYKIESIPETLAIGLPDELGFFKFKVTNNSNKIKVQSVLQFNSAIITPEYYQTLKEFYGKVVAKQNEKIVLSKT